MQISFSLDDVHAMWLTRLYAFTAASPVGPKFATTSALAKSLVEAILDDDAATNDSSEPTTLPH